ncbi:MAG: cytochrome c [Pseudomonadales bacterium]|jgi:mono/diheme cytochrome c family protein|nr:cytochrome c [Pseudomonadales bacterium]MDP7597060.1 cytochrome c [Pseudomonadales bacterium]HJN53190.1 cytochrome c [Pseudomonadales bacterium]|tara:strand:+ start:205 stop:732 length:528 start_codon:yes stop_codon:yes gene_type:complete
MKSYLSPLVLTITLLLPALGWTLPWDEDMRNQPSVKPQESQVTTNASSVPQKGNEPISPPVDLFELVQARLKAGELDNPIARDSESIIRGKLLYDIHCLVCHGIGGLGDGVVGKKYVPDPMNLTLDYVQAQPDGQIFYTISHGSIAMSFYRDAIPVSGRWDVVNYIKGVFGQGSE